MESKIKDLINLNKICFSIPKTDLHAHLNGSIRKSTLFEMLDEVDKEQLYKLYQDKMSFENAFKIFRISSKILKNLDIVRRITREMTEDWNKINCAYLEIRTSLKAINGNSKEDYLRAVLEEIYQSNQIYELQTRLIISLNRELPIEDYLDTYDLYVKFNDEKLKPLIVGIDYSGDETREAHKYNTITPILQKFRELGLKITIHMGEITNYQVMDFSKFKPDRISHTYFFKQEDREEIMRNKIPIEVCPTGGYCEKECTSYEQITFKDYYKQKVKINGQDYEYNLFCFGSDDVMLFTTDMTNEYFELVQAFNLTGEELKTLISNSIDHIFEQDESFKKALKEKINNYKII